MNDNPFSPNPFSARMALALVLFGAGVFVLLLWMVGAGLASGSTNDGGGHAGGRGLNGYAALAGFLEKRGYTVRRSRSEGALDDPGLLVLTPPPQAKGEALAKIVAARRAIGPTLVVTPKWIGAPAPAGTPGAKKGWTLLLGTDSPEWRGFLDDVGCLLGQLGRQVQQRSLEFGQPLELEPVRAHATTSAHARINSAFRRSGLAMPSILNTRSPKSNRVRCVMPGW